MVMHKVEISKGTIIFAVFFIILLYGLWILRDLMFSLLIAFILMSALKPSVRFLEKYKIPRKLAAVIVYLVFICLFVLLFSFIVPPIIIEGTALVKSLPSLIERLLSPGIGAWLNLRSLTQYIPNVTQQTFEILGNIFSNVFFVVTTLFFGLYFIIEEDIIKRFIIRVGDGAKVEGVVNIFNRAEKRMSAWFWGQITLMIVVGVLTFIGLNLIGMKYALALAVFAGLLEVIPNIGPLLSAVPAVLIGLSISPVMGLVAALVYLIVQQLENNLIVPWIMKRAVGLDPVVTLIALIIGGRFGGVLGVLLAIPILLFIGTFYLELRKDKELLKDFI